MNNVRNHYGLPCVVSINRLNFGHGGRNRAAQEKDGAPQAPVILATHWADGGKGRGGRARRGEAIEKVPSDFKYVYEDALPLWDKIKAIATKIYGARDVTVDAKIRGQIKKLQEDGYEATRCASRRRSTRSTDAQLRGAPSEHMINIREVRLAAGAEFIVMVCGDVMTMPGLPKVLSAEKIDLDEDGKVVGLF